MAQEVRCQARADSGQGWSDVIRWHAVQVVQPHPNCPHSGPPSSGPRKACEEPFVTESKLLDLPASIVSSDSAVINIASVIDVEDVDLFAVFVDGVADPVFPAPCAPMPFERGSQRCADPLWFFG